MIIFIANGHGKPAAIISYGGHGGGKAAEQLRQIGAALKMCMIATSSALTIPDEAIRNGAMLNPEKHFESHIGVIRQAFMELLVEMPSKC